MKPALFAAMMGAGLLLAPVAYGQTASVTATCKDGTSFSGTTRTGACRGHKGVASWGTAAATRAAPGMAPAAAPPTRSATAAPPPSVPGRTSNTASAKVGGPGQVWVNSASKVYHCPGDRYYGKTKSGAFMTQAAATAAGDHPSGGKACPS
ncbi:hypothetical protein [Rhodopila sp.]|uniref:hypothetical protein n=1 Tax=Rhodopila sp. TaxID=2480087 RepID=UPI003D09B99B